MRLDRGGKAISVCAVLLIGGCFVAYWHFTQKDAPQEPVVDSSPVEVQKNVERPPQQGLKIGGVQLPEDVSKITPATMDAILDGQDFTPTENPPPE